MPLMKILRSLLCKIQVFIVEENVTRFVLFQCGARARGTSRWRRVPMAGGHPILLYFYQKET